MKTILFQGDSITDCDRRTSSDGLGDGYPKLLADSFTGRAKCVNMGISGNRSRDLVARWDTDCIALKPDILTILIGINDTWRAFDNHDATSSDSYFQAYKNILSRVQEELPDTKVIILEPFLLSSTPEKIFWRTDLDAKIHCARELAREFQTGFIPLDGIFAQKSVSLGCAALAADGVHPTLLGHEIIAYLLKAEIEKLLA